MGGQPRECRPPKMQGRSTLLAAAHHAAEDERERARHLRHRQLARGVHVAAEAQVGGHHRQRAHAAAGGDGGELVRHLLALARQRSLDACLLLLLLLLLLLPLRLLHLLLRLLLLLLLGCRGAQRAEARNLRG